MAVRPELVKLDRAVEGWPNFPDFRGPAMPTIFAYFETRPASTTGRPAPGRSGGDPRASTAQLGEKFYTQITKGVCNVVADITEAETLSMTARKPARGLAGPLGAWGTDGKRWQRPVDRGAQAETQSRRPTARTRCRGRTRMGSGSVTISTSPDRWRSTRSCGWSVPATARRRRARPGRTSRRPGGRRGAR